MKPKIHWKTIMSSHVQGIQISGWKRDATVTKCLGKQATHTHTHTNKTKWYEIDSQGTL